MQVQPVVIALIKNKAGDVLIAQRQSHQSYSGLWEFPGGKIEKGEDQLVALKREIFEEVNLNILSATFLFSTTEISSPSLSIDMHIWECVEFTGKAYGKEGQEIQWVSVGYLSYYSFPPTNHLVLKWLTHALHSI